MSPSGSKSASSIPGGIESLVRQASISSKMKSHPSKGVREGEDVVMIGSENGEYLEVCLTLNFMASSLTRRDNSSPCTSINTHAVLKKGLPRMRGTQGSTS
ncbi:hypothetical protein Tco_0148718 [Tanacetum coccineum]